MTSITVGGIVDFQSLVVNLAASRMCVVTFHFAAGKHLMVKLSSAKSGDGRMGKPTMFVIIKNISDKNIVILGHSLNMCINVPSWSHPLQHFREEFSLNLAKIKGVRSTFGIFPTGLC